MKLLVAIVAGAIAGLLLGSSVATGSSLEGTVVRGADRTPLSGVMVDLYEGKSAQPQATAQTDSRGIFVVNGLAPGAYRIKLSHLAYDPIVLGYITIEDRAQLRMRDAIAMWPVGGRSNTAPSACVTLMQPLQTADEYTVCNDSH